MSRIPAPPLPALGALAATVALALAGCGDGDGGYGGGGAGDDESPAQFGYEGDVGPERWADLDPAHAACEEGEEQSPIELLPAEPGRQPPIRFDYEPGAPELDNNGHSIEASFPSGGSIEIGDQSYELRQVHYHAPSEHRIDDEQLPLELHFVHEGTDGELTVIGVGAVAGAHNPAFAGLIAELPATEGETTTAAAEVDPLELMPADAGEIDRFSYRGSLTTPPCTEGVRWEVLGDAIELSDAQLEAFTSIYEGTNRPLQERNGRVPVSRR